MSIVAVVPIKLNCFSFSFSDRDLSITVLLDAAQINTAGEFIAVSEIIVHPAPSDNDIALLRLNRAVRLNGEYKVLNNLSMSCIMYTSAKQNRPLPRQYPPCDTAQPPAAYDDVRQPAGIDLGLGSYRFQHKRGTTSQQSAPGAQSRHE